MSIITAKYVQFNTVEEYRNLFLEELVYKDLYFEGYKLFIHKEDFEHVCFDYDSKGNYKGKFSYRRASRIMLIKDVCTGNIPYKLIWQTKRKTPSICVLIEALDTGLYLIPKRSKDGFSLRLATIIAYGSRVEKRISKQLDSGILINKLEEVGLEVN